MLAQGDIRSWVLWSQPKVTLVFDSRSEIYSRRFHLEFARLMAAAPGWDDVVDRTGASYALVLQDSPIAAARPNAASGPRSGPTAVTSC